MFTNDGKEFLYTSYLNFTNSQLVVDKGEIVKFTCIFCEQIYSCKLGQTSNIKLHLQRKHRDIANLAKWLKEYNKCHTSHNKFYISNETIRIVKFFIAQNISASAFDCQHFRALLIDYKIKIPCTRTFSEVILSDFCFR